MNAGRVAPVRHPSRLAAVLVVVAVVGAAWLAGPSSGGAAEPEPVATSIGDYGPTAKAPRGGEPDPRGPWRSRWSYRGTLGRLPLDKQVVPPVAEPPAREDGRAPLTGLKATNLERRALVVKIDNVETARPPVNLGSADIVYEELVEGGYTRFAAVFHSKRVNVIGPVRSARSTDIGIAVSFNRPVFAFSGANSIFERLVREARLFDRGAESAAHLYWRGSSKPAPHNMFTSSANLLGAVPDGKNPKPHFEYRDKGEKIPADVLTASTIQLQYQRGRGVPVRYEWDASVGGWRRWQNGSRHLDSAGVQLAPENVVVQVVPYADAGLTDKWGEILYEAQLVQTGEALVFTDGHVYEATWTRPTLRSVTTFTDTDGNPIPLTRGRTWVALVPPGGVTFDSIRCKGRPATVAGTLGNDTLRGTPERDVIAARSGDDLVIAGGGNDLVCADDGNDQVHGGDGNDVVYGGGGSDRLIGDDGRDRLIGGADGDLLEGGRARDVMRGGSGADVLVGDKTVDKLATAADDVYVRGR